MHRESTEPTCFARTDISISIERYDFIFPEYALPRTLVPLERQRKEISLYAIPLVERVGKADLSSGRKVEGKVVDERWPGVADTVSIP